MDAILPLAKTRIKAYIPKMQNIGKIGENRAFLRQELTLSDIPDTEGLPADLILALYSDETDFYLAMNEEALDLTKPPEVPGDNTSLQAARTMMHLVVWRLVRKNLENGGGLRDPADLMRTYGVVLHAPPPLPEEVLKILESSDPEEEIKGLYDPEQDTALLEFIERYKVVAESFGFDRDPRFFRVVSALFDPYKIRLCWPSNLELSCFELSLCQSILDKKIEFSGYKLDLYLISNFGFTQADVEKLHRMSRKYACDNLAMDPEELTAIAIQHVEYAIRRARRINDIELLLKSLNMWAKIAGVQGDKGATDLANTVREAISRSSKERHKSLPLSE